MSSSEAPARPRHLPRWGLAGILLCLASCILAIRAHPTEARPLHTGLTNIGSSAPLAFVRTRETGARLVRIPLNWSAAAPSSPPTLWNPEDPADPAYTWRFGDASVLGAVAAGLTPVLQIDGAPPWAERCTPPPSLPWAICDPDPAALRAFAVAAARRYSGAVPGIPRVRYWQALNEPNLSIFVVPQFDSAGGRLSPILYRSLLNSFYSGVKAVDPSNLVLAAGLGPIAVPSSTIGPMQFARDLLCMTGRKRPRPLAGTCDGGVRFDIFAIHPYTNGAPSREGRADDVQLGGLAKLQVLLRAAERAGRIKSRFKRTPLWITEFSWDSSPPDPGGLAMSTLTRWTAEALHRAWHDRVSNFFWFSLHDDLPGSNQAFSASLESGLYFRGPTLEEDKPKPVLQAFRFPFVAYPGPKGLFFWGRTPNSGPGRIVLQAQAGRRWRGLLKVRAGRDGIFRGVMKNSYGRGKRGSVRAVFAGEASIPFSMRPVKDFYQRPFG